jgi:hypothetical protein
MYCTTAHFSIIISHRVSNSAEISSPPIIIFNFGHSCLLLSAVYNVQPTSFSSSMFSAFSPSKFSAYLKDDATLKFP